MSSSLHINPENFLQLSTMLWLLGAAAATLVIWLADVFFPQQHCVSYRLFSMSEHAAQGFGRLNVFLIPLSLLSVAISGLCFNDPETPLLWAIVLLPAACAAFMIVRASCYRVPTS